MQKRLPRRTPKSRIKYNQKDQNNEPLLVLVSRATITARKIECALSRIDQHEAKDMIRAALQEHFSQASACEPDLALAYFIRSGETRKTLQAAGITSGRQMAAMTRNQLYALPGLSRKAAQQAVIDTVNFFG